MPDQGLLDVLRRSGGLVAISRQLAVAPSVALGVATALMPLVRGGFRRRVEQARDFGAGVADLHKMLQLLDAAPLAGRLLQEDFVPSATDRSAGTELVAALFGSEAGAKQAIAAAANQSGVDRDIVAQTVPLLATLAAGYLAARGGRLSSPEWLAELGRLLGLDEESNPLDAVV